MSTNISTAYEAIRTAITAVLPNHVELSNAYFVEKEAVINYPQAWGLSLADGRNTNRVLDCKMSIERDFHFIVTRKIFKTEKRDLTTQATAWKNLFEDHLLVIKQLELSPVLNSSSSGITRIVYDSDTGLQFVEDRTDLIYMVTTFRVEYFENL